MGRMGHSLLAGTGPEVAVLERAKVILRNMEKSKQWAVSSRVCSSNLRSTKASSSERQGSPEQKVGDPSGLVPRGGSWTLALLSTLTPHPRLSRSARGQKHWAGERRGHRMGDLAFGIPRKGADAPPRAGLGESESGSHSSSSWKADFCFQLPFSFKKIFFSLQK